MAGTAFDPKSMDAVFGKLLDVDLTTGRIGEYTVPETWEETYLGGKGLAARILLQEYKGGDPLAPHARAPPGPGHRRGGMKTS